jgi:hypothetical protein
VVEGMLTPSIDYLDTTCTIARERYATIGGVTVTPHHLCKISIMYVGTRNRNRGALYFLLSCHNLHKMRYIETGTDRPCILTIRQALPPHLPEQNPSCPMSALARIGLRDLSFVSLNVKLPLQPIPVHTYRQSQFQLHI